MSLVDRALIGVVIHEMFKLTEFMYDIHALSLTPIDQGLIHNPNVTLAITQ